MSVEREALRSAPNSMALPSELDLWRTAQVLGKQHGERSPEEARKRAERFAEEGRMPVSRMLHLGCRLASAAQYLDELSQGCYGFSGSCRGKIRAACQGKEDLMSRFLLADSHWGALLWLNCEAHPTTGRDPEVLSGKRFRDVAPLMPEGGVDG